MKRVQLGLFLLALMSLSFITQELSAQQWIRNISETKFTAIAVFGDEIFAGTYTGDVYKSTDGGSLWMNISQDANGYEITGFVQQDNKLFLTTHDGGIFKSTNNGNSWVSVHSPQAYTLAGISKYEFSIFVATNSGVLRSNDVGQSWDLLDNGLASDDVRQVVKSGDWVFAATENGMFRSSNNGSDWMDASQGMTDKDLRCVNYNGSIVLAGAASGIIYRSSDHGQTWTNTNSGSLNPIIDIELKSNTYYALSSTTVYKSTNTGASWSGTSVAALSSPEDMVVTDVPFAVVENGIVKFDPVSSNWDLVASIINRYSSTTVGGYSNVIFTGTDQEGVFVSDNKGKQWKKTHLADNNVSYLSSLGIDGYYYIGTETNGLYKSIDGNNWSQVNIGLGSNKINNIQHYESILYVSCNLGGLFKSTDNGVVWSGINSGLPTIDIYSLIIMDTFYYIATAQGIFRSTNTGLNWTSHNNGLTSLNVIDLDRDNDTLYAVTQDGVFKSTDKAANWVEINNGIGGAEVNSLVVNKGFLFIATELGVMRSTDKGSSWEDYNLNEISSAVYELSVIDQEVYAASKDNGVYRLTELKEQPSSNPAELRLVTVGSNSATVEWEHSTGEVLPDGYLLLGKRGASSYASFADGTEIPTDTNWHFNHFVVYIDYDEDVTSYSFDNLDPNTNFGAKIVAYTNNSVDINFNPNDAPEVSFKTYEAEPSNHVTDYSITARSQTSLTLRFRGSFGGVIPHSYLILTRSSQASSWPVVEDGLPITDDSDVSDGIVAYNIDHKSGMIDFEITGLLSGGEYNIRIYPYTNTGDAINYKLDGELPELSGTTLKEEPAEHVTTLITEVISSDSIKLLWQESVVPPVPDKYLVVIVETGTEMPLIEDGIPYDDDSDFSDGIGFANVDYFGGSNSSTINGLYGNTEYTFYVYPYSNNDDDIDYKTDGEVPQTTATTFPGPPGVVTLNANVISSSSVIIEAEINATGGESAYERGVIYYDYDLQGKFIGDEGVTLISETGEYQAGAYSVDIDELEPQKRYSVRAYAINNGGTGYGKAESFWTFSPEPESHADSFSAIIGDDVVFNFPPAASIGNAKGYIIIGRDGQIPEELPEDGKSYLSGNMIGNSMVMAVIINPDAESFVIAAEDNYSNYTFMLVPYNWNNTNSNTYNYKTDGSIPISEPGQSVKQPEAIGIELSVNPNPVNQVSDIEIRFGSSGDYKIYLNDLNGLKVKEIAKGYTAAASHRFQIESSGLSSGLYFLMIRHKGKLSGIKIQITK
ncbi:MAG: HVO_0234 family beta-propeller protein [Bacteroidota bacterium]